MTFLNYYSILSTTKETLSVRSLEFYFDMRWNWDLKSVYIHKNNARIPRFSIFQPPPEFEKFFRKDGAHSAVGQAPSH